MPKARDTGRGKEPRGRKRQGAIANEEPAAAVLSDPVAPAGSVPTLDESQAGSPVLVGGGPLGAAGGPPLGGPTVPPNEDLIVEIQLAPGATALRSALVGNTAAFLGSA